MSKTLRTYFAEYPNASLRKLAAATESYSYGILLKKSKEPIVGQPYDPDFINYEAVESALKSRDVDIDTIDWDALNEGRSRESFLIKDVDAFKVGDKVYLRRNNTTPYNIVYKTNTHIVILLDGTSEPQSWQLSTFMLNGPTFEPRATKTEDEA